VVVAPKGAIGWRETFFVLFLPVFKLLSILFGDYDHSLFFNFHIDILLTVRATHTKRGFVLKVAYIQNDFIAIRAIANA